MDKKSLVGWISLPRVVDGRTMTVRRLSEVLAEKMETFRRPLKTVDWLLKALDAVAITVGTMREVIGRESREDVWQFFVVVFVDADGNSVKIVWDGLVVVNSEEVPEMRTPTQ